MGVCRIPDTEFFILFKEKPVIETMVEHLTSSVYPHMEEGARELSGVSFIRALFAFMRASPS